MKKATIITLDDRLGIIDIKYMSANIGKLTVLRHGMDSGTFEYQLHIDEKWQYLKIKAEQFDSTARRKIASWDLTPLEIDESWIVIENIEAMRG